MFYNINISDALLAAIIGAGITVCFSYKQENFRIRQEKINILHSLKSELLAIQALINVRKNDILNNMNTNSPEDTTSYNFVYLPITYNYFTVYDGLAPKLGVIDDKNLVNKIICSYADIKGLWENVKDLEFVAKKGLDISLSDEGTPNHQKAVTSHYNYVNFILHKQLPLVEKVITDCIFHIEIELLNLKH